MTKPVQLSQRSWTKISKQIAAEHKPSVLLIRDKMRSVLGFTNRNHKEWIDTTVEAEDFGMYQYRGHYAECVMLDFFDERKRTMFLLKYSEILNDRNKS